MTAAAVMATLFLAAPAVAFEIPEWPSQQGELLRQVEERMMETQRRLSAARRRDDTENVTELHEMFTELRSQRIAVLRAMRELY
jgi:uncharacterized membrane protein (DUF106 family)